MPLLTLTDVDKRFGPDIVLRGVCLKVNRGEHVALVGINGSGKSTLLRIIAGLESVDGGQVSRAGNCIVGYVPQNADFRLELTLWDVMTEAFSLSFRASEQMRELETRMTSAPTICSFSSRSET